MGIGLKNRLAVGATPVPDVFIDTYMAGASGEYVKVYLYLLRHQQEEVSIGQIADALNHTEADVQRALAYWQRAGKRHRSERCICRLVWHTDGGGDLFNGGYQHRRYVLCSAGSVCLFCLYGGGAGEVLGTDAGAVCDWCGSGVEY